MTKEVLIDIAGRYGMEFIRHHITREGSGVYCVSPESISELDAICDKKELDNVIGQRELIPGKGYVYRLYCPAQWIDLAGWN